MKVVYMAVYVAHSFAILSKLGSGKDRSIRPSNALF